MNLRDETLSTQIAEAKTNDPNLENLLSVYPEEVIGKLMKDKKKLERITKSFSCIKSYTDTNSILMTCNHECPYWNMCVLAKEDLAPIGHPCPVEKKIVAEISADLIESLKIQPNNLIEMELLWDLIDIKLLDMRASGGLKAGYVTQKVEQQVGKVSQSKDEMAPQIEIKTDLKHLKHSIIDMFVATRRAKRKYGTVQDKNNLEKLLMEAAAHKNIEDKTQRG